MMFSSTDNVRPQILDASPDTLVVLNSPEQFNPVRNRCLPEAIEPVNGRLEPFGFVPVAKFGFHAPNLVIDVSVDEVAKIVVRSRIGDEHWYVEGLAEFVKHCSRRFEELGATILGKVGITVQRTDARNDHEIGALARSSNDLLHQRIVVVGSERASDPKRP